jgi:hypothetical protein
LERIGSTAIKRPNNEIPVEQLLDKKEKAGVEWVMVTISEICDFTEMDIELHFIREP